MARIVLRHVRSEDEKVNKGQWGGKQQNKHFFYECWSYPLWDLRSGHGRLMIETIPIKGNSSSVKETSLPLWVMRWQTEIKRKSKVLSPTFSLICCFWSCGFGFCILGREWHSTCRCNLIPTLINTTHVRAPSCYNVQPIYITNIKLSARLKMCSRTK